MPGGVHASVSCPLLHPLWPYPLRPLLYRVSSRSRERPNKLDRTGDRQRAARFKGELIVIDDVIDLIFGAPAGLPKGMDQVIRDIFAGFRCSTDSSQH
ncbi:Uncharacterised protein [Mycobacteroides abscessus subsp. abscessus]|nr:Uncharacterised protein [Mycobacteroides abscessus subsp. abscessus]